MVAALDAPQFGAQLGQYAPPFGVVRVACVVGLGEDLLVFGGPGLGHVLHELLFVTGGGRLGDPHGGGAAEVGDLLGDPLQLLLGVGTCGQSDQAVTDLSDSQALELAPDGDPRGGGLAR